MTITQPEILFFILVCLCAWLSLKLLFGLINSITNYLLKRCDNDQEWVKNAPATQIIQGAIYYCNNILYEKEIEHFPQLKLSYYHHKRFQGHYNNGVVTIYVKKTKTVHELVTVLLHETSHYIQDYTDSRYKEYDELLEKYGYESHPLEQDAIKFSEQHLENCMIYLEERCLIKRA